MNQEAVYERCHQILDAAPAAAEGGMSMEIYIKGMEMPKSCFDCPFMYGRKYCRANSKIEFNDPDYSELKGRYPGCPLVPVPPHGRLIEKNAVFELIRSFPNVDRQLPVEFMKVLYELPTIIEAEEGE